MDQKFKLNHSKQFQLDAIESTIKLFEGQRKIDSSFIDFVDGVSSNKLDLTENEILENLNKIQDTNLISISNQLDGMNFSIEMETGTGKTYVYLRTIYELNKQYGFKKFIIVVPNVAIREGTKKNFEIVKDDFEILYNKIPIRCGEYQSKNLSYVKDFCRSNKIEIMIITLDAFNKDNNILNTPHPEHGFYGKKPIELIHKTKPILILDEPQNMETPTSREAISNMNPLLTLRYSATHKYPYNLIYRLSPIDALKQKLVKRIQVYSVTEDVNANKPNITCVSVTSKNNKIKAKLKVIKNTGGKIKLATITVKDGDKLEKLTNLTQYHNYIVSKLYVNKFIEFRNGTKIEIGNAIGSNQTEIQRIQIRESIQSHFDIQQELKDKNIKVLSLFFIDKVSNYLDGGILQKFFDEEFNKLKTRYPDFAKLEPQNVRDGYFSRRKTDSEIIIKKDSEAFEKIMKAKERLLSFDEPTSFIFSHSALREGWDNPNVFVICTLNQSVSITRKRQEIGRGLRLPVSTPELIQQTDDEYTLRVIANESYEDYVKTLQNEYNKDYGPGASPSIENARKQVWVTLDTAKFESKEFRKLWEKISPTTNYSTHIESDEFIKQCIEKIEKDLEIEPLGIRLELASTNMTEEEEDLIKITPDVMFTATDEIKYNYLIGNIIDEFSEKLNLTKKTIIKILTGIKNLNLIFNDPQKFVISTSEIIKKILNSHIINGIEYYLDGKTLPKYDIFRHKIKTYEYKTIDADISIYDKVIFEYNFEKEIAQRLSSQKERVKLYMKLPSRFVITTPVGNYNPDWAIVSEKKDLQGNLQETFHFVIETKAKDELDLGTSERLKMDCGKKHFKILNVPYKVVKEMSELEKVLNNE